MIVGIGTDIVKVSRFEDKQKSPQFLKRVFSLYEQEYLHGKGIESMAGLFAAKEAVAKALGVGFNGFFPCEIEIRHDENGKPFVNLHGKAKELAGDEAVFHVSISHTDENAVAFVIITIKEAGLQ